ncbi:MAG: shikimate dehydrogenase [Undibacterium sp.]|nr:shikimate dehydrogenase [Undibacterium sp.]
MSLSLDHYVVIGNPIAHSKSPQIHRIFAQQTQQNLSYETLLAPLDGFAASVRNFITSGGKGANVTVPFKLQAFSLATQLTPRASVAGAVNTLLFDAEYILGDNTDGAGLVRDIVTNAACEITGKRVLLMGAGGAARGALLPLLEQRPSELVIANRTLSKAEELVDLAQGLDSHDMVVRASSWEALDEPFDLIINATAASLAQQVPPIAAIVFAKNCLAYDMMYSENITPFLSFARQHGAQTRDGWGMLVEQAAEAFYLWRGVRPDTGSLLASD